MKERINHEELKPILEGFQRVEAITDIIVLGEDGGVRRIQFDKDSLYGVKLN